MSAHASIEFKLPDDIGTHISAEVVSPNIVTSMFDVPSLRALGMSMPFDIARETLLAAQNVTSLTIFPVGSPQQQAILTNCLALLPKLTALTIQTLGFGKTRLTAAHIPFVTSLNLDKGATIDRPPARLQRLTLPLSERYRALLLRLNQRSLPVDIVV